MFFVTPPALVFANEPEEVSAIYGFASGGAVVAGLAAVMSVSVYQILLNRTRNGMVHTFAKKFRIFMLLPLIFAVSRVPDAIYSRIIYSGTVYTAGTYRKPVRVVSQWLHLSLLMQCTTRFLSPAL